MDALNKGYINWKDGMKISEKHFEYLQISLEERIKDSRAANLDYYNHGILGSGADGSPPLLVQFRTEEKNSVFVSVTQCRGVTRSGDRVEVLASSDHLNEKKLERKITIQESELKRGLPILVTIKVDNEAMMSYGKPDPEESPLRYPYKKPGLSIETIIPETDTNAIFRNNLVIGRLLVSDGAISIDVAYIPPSTTMRSHNDLREFAFDYLDFLNDVEENIFTILRNLGSKDQLTQLAQTVGKLSEDTLHIIQSNIDEIKTFGPAFSPAHFVLNSKQVARAIRNCISIATNEQREELLNYIKEIIDMGPGEFTNLNTEILDLEYDHFAIKNCLEKVSKFKNVISRLFKEWSQLDYIGKKKKTGIFVGEVREDSESTKEKKKWDF